MLFGILMEFSMSTSNDPIDTEQAPAIIVTEGPAMPNPREKAFLSSPQC